MNKRDTIIKWSIIAIFVALYAMVSIISTIHVIDFFRLSNPEWLAVTLAIAFEVGAAACLGAIVILDRTSRWLVWSLFILITGMQMTGNMYYAYIHLENFQGWIELFGLQEEELIFQKRILSIVSGAILPVVALGFIKSLVDYIRPQSENLQIPEEIKESDNSNEEDSTYDWMLKRDDDELNKEWEEASLADLDRLLEYGLPLFEGEEDQKKEDPKEVSEIENETNEEEIFEEKIEEVEEPEIDIEIPNSPDTYNKNSVSDINSETRIIGVQPKKYGGL